MNVEYLLDVFTSTNADSKGVRDARSRFMDPLSWHKPRPVIPGPNYELFCVHFSLVQAFFKKSKFSDANPHVTWTNKVARDQWHIPSVSDVTAAG